MTHRFSFACLPRAGVRTARGRAWSRRGSGLYGLPLFDHDARTRLGQASPRDHGGTATGCPNAARAGGIGDRALPTSGPCGARLIGLGVADAVAADAAHSAGRPQRPGGACAAAGTAADRGARPRSANSQPVARSRDIPGPRVALRLPARPQWRAGDRKQSLHGRLPAVSVIPGRREAANLGIHRYSGRGTWIGGGAVRGASRGLSVRTRR